MNKEQILNTIRNLAENNGFYGRLYSSLTNGNEDTKEFLAVLENQSFKDEIELICYLEGS